jgi:hypothetical protein
MKINSKFIKCLIFIYLFSNICENLIANCSKSTLSAAFKSNFQLMSDKKKSTKEGSEEGVSAHNNKVSNTPHDHGAASIPDIPILYQTWAKYFSYRSDGNNKPNNFFVNDDYQTQTEEEMHSQEKDSVINYTLSILARIIIHQIRFILLFDCLSRLDSVLH